MSISKPSTRKVLKGHRNIALELKMAKCSILKLIVLVSLISLVLTLLVFQSMYLENNQQKVINSSQLYVRNTANDEWGSIKRTKDFRHIRNLCIVENKFQDKIDFIVYNSDPKLRDILIYDYQTHIHMDWKISFVCDKRPTKLTVVQDSLYMIPHMYPGNLYHWLEDMLLNLYSMMDVTGNLDEKHHNYVQSNTCDKHEFKDNFLFILDKLGPRITYDHCFATTQIKNMCFKNAYFGQVKEKREKFIGTITKNYDLSLNDCRHRNIIFLNRTSRRITNLDHLVSSVKSLGVKSQQIRVVQLETLSFEQQMQEIICSALLIGVQGAGLVWYNWIPRPGALIELGWDGWPPYMYHKLARKRGLYIDTVYAYDSNIDWMKYKRKNKIKGKLSDKQKIELKIRILNKFSALDRNPYKIADGTFNVKQFRNTVQKVLTKLRNKGVEI